MPRRVHLSIATMGAMQRLEDTSDLPERPRTRADCAGGPRPCPWVSCRHHLYLDVLPNGALEHAPVEVHEMVDSCALDVADEGPHSSNEVGEVLGCARQRIEWIEKNAQNKLAGELRADVGQEWLDEVLDLAPA